VECLVDNCSDVVLVCFRCIPCPVGHYIDSDDFTCKACPTGTVAYSGLLWGIESCVKCGSGLVPFKGQRCVSHCTYQSPDKKNYNFTELARSGSLQQIVLL